MRRNALFILGMHRSGASALAAAMVKAGASPGRALAVPAGQRLAAGFEETASLVALDTELLRTLGTRWDSLAPLPERWSERPLVRSLAARARETVRNEYGSEALVVAKDARMSLCAPFWRAAFEAEGYEVSVAITVRRPAEVVASLARGEPVAPEKALLLWLAYLVEAERGTRGVPRCLVTFDALLKSPAEAIAQVVAATRLPIPAAAREAAATAVNVSLRRHVAGERPATGLVSGLDLVLDDGYARLARLSAASDPRREVEALAQAARTAIDQAIPPWIARELVAARDDARDRTEELAQSREAIATLEAAREQALAAQRLRDKATAELRARLESLSRPGNPEGREQRIDEALAGLRGDVARIAYTLGDQPAREQALRLELSHAQRDLADERATIGKLSEEIETLRDRTLEQKRALDEAHGHLTALIEEVERFQASESSHAAHLESMQQELATARADASQAQTAYDAARKDLDLAVRQLEPLRLEAEALRRELPVAKRERDLLQEQARQLSEAVGALKAELDRAADASRQLASERDRFAQDARAATERINALDRELARRGTELVAATGRVEMLTRRLNSLERGWLGRLALRGVQSGRS